MNLRQLKHPSTSPSERGTGHISTTLANSHLSNQLQYLRIYLFKINKLNKIIFCYGHIRYIKSFLPYTGASHYRIFLKYTFYILSCEDKYCVSLPVILPYMLRFS